MADQIVPVPPVAAGTGAGTNALAQDPELVSEFILESQEHLRAIEAHLLAIDRGEASSDAINAIFRGFHTIKGLSGFLEFEAMQRVSHEVETVLDRARNGELVISRNVIDVVLESSDFLKAWLTALQAGPAASGPDPAGMIAQVRTLLQPASGSESGSPAPAGPAAPPAVAEEPSAAQTAPAGIASAEPAQVEKPAPKPAASKPPAGKTAGPKPPAPNSPETSLAALAGNMPPTKSLEPPKAAPAAESRSIESRVVKIDTSKLDHLVDMVGEMVIAQSMIQHDPEMKAIDRPRLVRNITQLARITDEVQKTAMAMRMMPVEHLFQRMRRVVRDLARKTGKQVEMEISGGETELDRNLVEELGDPLMHMLRNSVDHGIELPEERIAKGKPATGRVHLSASHRSGHIVIEVGDDGAGLDRRKILEKARKSGLLADGEELTDDRVNALIFEPGFSTAAKVTDVSGRGVGMDVVRRQVQKLRGRVEIQNTPGKGATFFLKLPLTLAIVEGLIVGVGKERYIIPLFAVREMLRCGSDAIMTVQDKGEIAVVRGQLLPLVRLYRRFGIEPKSEDPAKTLLIVAEGANRVFTLMVDELIGKQEVVIKNLGAMLQNVPGIAGGAILGDGRVGLILDLDRVFDPSGGALNSHVA